MRRGLLLASAVVLLLTLALWITARVEKGAAHPHAAAHKRKAPTIVAGRDHTTRGAQATPLASADPANASLRCHYDGEDDPGTLFAVGATGVVDGRASGPDLSLILAPGDWSVFWKRSEGTALPLGKLELEAGDDETCVLGDAGWDIDGQVKTPDGRPLEGADVMICGDLVHTDSDGGFQGTSRGQTCLVRAIWRDGLLSRRTEPLEVDPFEAHGITLTIDDTPVAGMGLAFRMGEDGARVLQVYAGSPAEAAGVEEGDVIVSVDGTATTGLSNDAFVALGTGSEGSSIVLELANGDGDVRTVRFRRARIERRRDTG
jgi:hypothetical protein